MQQGLMLNLDGKQVQSERYPTHIAASKPLKKYLWKYTVMSKIKNQGAVLQQLGFNTKNMKYWERSVNSGDTSN